MKKTMVLTLVLGSLISTSYSRHQEPKGLADLIGGPPELAVRFVAQIKRCKAAKKLGDKSNEDRFCDFSPLLIEGEKGNGKTALYCAMQSDAGIYKRVLSVGNMYHENSVICVQNIKNEIDYVAAGAESENSVRFVVIEEVERFKLGVQAGLKDLMDEEEYRGKILFILTSNNFAALEEDLVDRCPNQISKYRPKKEERHIYIDGFCDEFDLKPKRSQLKYMQDYTDLFNVRLLLELVKRLNTRCGDTMTQLLDDDLKLEIEAIIKGQKKYSTVHGLNPTFSQRNHNLLEAMKIGAAVTAVSAVTGGVIVQSQGYIKSFAKKNKDVVIKVVKASPGVVIEGVKCSCCLVGQGVGYAWHIFF